MIITMEINGISHMGEGVGRHEGKACFVPGALLGERVRAHVTEERKGWMRARLAEVLSPHPQRVDPPCPVYAICGGCQLQHADYPLQLELKERMVKEVLARVGRLKDMVPRAVKGMDNPWHYRNKAQFHVSGKAIGYYSSKSHSIVEYDACPLLPKDFRPVIAHVRESLPAAGTPHPLRHLVVRRSSLDGRFQVILVTAAPWKEAPPLARSLMDNLPAVVSVVESTREGRGDGLLGVLGPNWRVLAGEERLVDGLGPLRFELSPPSFWQVNPEQTSVLYAEALAQARLSGGEEVWEAYCGIGSISLFLARKAGSVRGVEAVEAAVEDARRNAEMNGIGNTAFFAGRAEELFPRWAKEGSNPDVIVVDPPRKGLDPQVITAILKSSPQRVVYVSCDPGTLARDLRLLGEGGYRVQEVQPVDMFPQTHHVECVVLMSRL